MSLAIKAETKRATMLPSDSSAVPASANKNATAKKTPLAMQWPELKMEWPDLGFCGQNRPAPKFSCPSAGCDQFASEFSCFDSPRCARGAAGKLSMRVKQVPRPEPVEGRLDSKSSRSSVAE